MQAHIRASPSQTAPSYRVVAIWSSIVVSTRWYLMLNPSKFQIGGGGVIGGSGGIGGDTACAEPGKTTAIRRIDNNRAKTAILFITFSFFRLIGVCLKDDAGGRFVPHI